MKSIFEIAAAWWVLRSYRGLMKAKTWVGFMDDAGVDYWGRIVSVKKSSITGKWTIRLRSNTGYTETWDVPFHLGTFHLI